MQTCCLISDRVWLFFPLHRKHMSRSLNTIKQIQTSYSPLQEFLEFKFPPARFRRKPRPHLWGEFVASTVACSDSVTTCQSGMKWNHAYECWDAFLVSCSALRGGAGEFWMKDNSQNEQSKRKKLIFSREKLKGGETHRCGFSLVWPKRLSWTSLKKSVIRFPPRTPHQLPAVFLKEPLARILHHSENRITADVNRSCT